jgi:hypothetical protein
MSNLKQMHAPSSSLHGHHITVAPLSPLWPSWPSHDHPHHRIEMASALFSSHGHLMTIIASSLYHHYTTIIICLCLYTQVWLQASAQPTHRCIGEHRSAGSIQAQPTAWLYPSFVSKVKRYPLHGDGAA